eukprot:672-Rhodomonas_salina.2
MLNVGSYDRTPGTGTAQAFKQKVMMIAGPLAVLLLLPLLQLEVLLASATDSSATAPIRNCMSSYGTVSEHLGTSRNIP